ncbi:hypothetical protein B0T17DRAFT_618166 [Bombardia bombarda]|uniref:Uncharacterized protein n=1 Tax=Bombardia bombarda TaxID=252184 RepID=A0AA39WUD7_9PEZI|nr:hypothetical protein B0T17DRAFT_618166 [Bombardia bombarda]
MDADTSSTSTSSISRGSSSGGSKSGASGSATSSSGTSSSGTSSSSSSIDTSTITAAPSISTSSPASSETAILPKNNNSSIGVGAKVGISLGAIFGAFLILGALSALWLVYRRKKGENGQRSADMGATAAGNNGPDGEFKPPALPEMPNSPATPDTPAFGELSNEHTARPWSMRSELPSHQGATSPSLSQISPQLPFVPPPTVDEEDPYYQAQPQPPKRVSSYPGQPQYRPYRASTQYDAMSPSSFELPG